jgi:ElaB/YqjD/DUF883 family membrane-anchored ribosome-binding protein
MSSSLEGTVKHGIGRLEGSVADLIDNSQALARSAFVEAVEAFQHGREQARGTAHDALSYSRDRAHRSYDQFEKIVGRQPLLATVIGVGIGVALGFLLHASATKPIPTVKAAPVRTRAKFVAAAPTTPKPKAPSKKVSGSPNSRSPRLARRVRTPAPAKESLQ